LLQAVHKVAAPIGVDVSSILIAMREEQFLKFYLPRALIDDRTT
jgi:hypothetical protein